jgi:hypothetical protein
MGSLTLGVCWFYKHQITSKRGRWGPILATQTYHFVEILHLPQILKNATLLNTSLQDKDTHSCY